MKIQIAGLLLAKSSRNYVGKDGSDRVYKELTVRLDSSKELVKVGVPKGVNLDSLEVDEPLLLHAEIGAGFHDVLRVRVDTITQD